MRHEFICGDCLAEMKRLPPRYVDLVFGSPPYEDRRAYGIDFNMKGQAWVDWMVQVYKESLRICKGLVAFVVEGKTQHFQWSVTPAVLMADLHYAGITLRKSPAFYRIGIPGSGGPDWLRNDYEFIVCATNGGRLPWSDNTAMGNVPKYGCFDGRVPHGYSEGDVKHVPSLQAGGPFSNRRQDGERVSRIQKAYEKANPGNVIKCVVGGGKMGSPLAHENEAPFPESLAEFFVRSFCLPGGIVLDPFLGSGTVAAVAEKMGRNSVGIDIRQSQIDLAKRRLEEIE